MLIINSNSIYLRLLSTLQFALSGLLLPTVMITVCARGASLGLFDIQGVAASVAHLSPKKQGYLQFSRFFKPLLPVFSRHLNFEHVKT